MSQESYVLNKFIPDMARGFTIHTNFGEYQVPAEDAGRYIQLLKMQMQQKLSAAQFEEPAIPNLFAKLYNTPKGQILVKLDVENDSNSPEVRFYVKPAHSGICTLGLSFDEDEAGWKEAEAYFDDIDEKIAIKSTRHLFELGVK